MKPEKIKPIPKYIQKLIYKEDLKRHPDQKGYLRFYAISCNGFSRQLLFLQVHRHFG